MILLQASPRGILMVSKTDKLDASERPAELICAVQNYEWGLRGEESLVAQIYSKNNPNSSIEEGKPYAEVIILVILIFLFHVLFSYGWGLISMDRQRLKIVII